MKKDSRENPGIKLLLKHYRSMFRVKENLHYYSSRDYKIAEKIQLGAFGLPHQTFKAGSLRPCFFFSKSQYIVYAVIALELKIFAISVDSGGPLKSND
jgi:hypothetical protein